MPGHRTHEMIGYVMSIAFTLLLFGTTFQGVQWAWSLLLSPVVILVYATLPDLDHPMSRLRKRYHQVMFGLMLLGGFLAVFFEAFIILAVLAILGFLGLLLLRMKHRGPLHSYWFIAALSAPLLAVHWYLFMLALISGWSHIFLDRTVTKTKRVLRAFKRPMRT